MTTITLASAPSSSARLKTIGLWAVKIIFGLLFIGAGAAKLAGVPAMVAEFDVVGLGQWFRYFTGVLEVGGAVLLLVPRTAFYGAAVLAIVSLGATVAQVAAIHQDWIHAVVFTVILGAIAWAHRGSKA